MISEHIIREWDRLTKRSDWRQVVSAQPWQDAPYAVLGVSNGPGSTRSRWASFEVFQRGRLVASRPRMDEAKEWAEKLADRPLTWERHRIEPIEVDTRLHGRTREFSGPTTWWSGS